MPVISFYVNYIDCETHRLPKSIQSVMKKTKPDRLGLLS